MCDLSGRTAIITGAASGIGAASAKAFGTAGANVVLGWYPGDPHDVKPVVRAIESGGGKAIACELDVTSTASVDALVRSALDTFGQLDIVVANAGIARTVPALELTDEAWNKVVDLNLTGAWRCFRAALPHMLDRGYGRLLATSSVAGTRQSWTEHVHYAASKAGIAGMVSTLGIEVGGRGVTVNAVAPGVIETPQALDPVNSLGPEGVAAAGRANPVGRVGKPEDVAALYLFLASESAGFINGQVITIDGGRSLVIRD